MNKSYSISEEQERPDEDLNVAGVGECPYGQSPTHLLSTSIIGPRVNKTFGPLSYTKHLLSTKYTKQFQKGYVQVSKYKVRRYVLSTIIYNIYNIYKLSILSTKYYKVQNKKGGLIST